MPSPETVLFDDFDVALLKWAQLAGTVTRTTTRAFNGTGSLSVAAAAGANAVAARGFPLTPNKRLGFECRWAVTNFNVLQTLGFSLGYSVDTCVADIRYIPSTHYWTCGNNTGFQSILPSYNALQYLPAPAVGGGWHTLKFIADFSLKKYVSLEVDDMVLDLGAFDLAFAGFDGPRGSIISLSIQAYAAGGVTLFVDDVRVTTE